MSRREHNSRGDRRESYSSESTALAASSILLLEDGDALLLEDGDFILLES